MLLADSICASPEFTKSFRSEMAAIFSNRKLERIPVADPLPSITYGGSDLRIVSRRDPATAPPAADGSKPRSTRFRPTWKASSLATAGAWSSRNTT